MREKSVVQLVRYDRGYLQALEDIRRNSVPRSLEQLKAALKKLGKAARRRAYVICLIDRCVFSMGAGIRALEETAEAWFIEKGLPDCYFDQSRPK